MAEAIFRNRDSQESDLEQLHKERVSRQGINYNQQAMYGRTIPLLNRSKGITSSLGILQ